MELIILKDYCIVCRSGLQEAGRSVWETTDSTNEPVYKFLETFTSRVFEENALSEAEICLTCYEKFRKYDRLMTEASEIQEDLTILFNNCQSKLHDEFEADNLEEECIVEEDENLFELVEVDIAEVESGDKKPILSLYTCDTCNGNFQKKKDYKAHIRIAHLPEDVKLFSCTECSELFPSERELLLHNAISHHQTDKFECPICKKVFSAKNLLVRHFNIHLSSRPYSCEECKKSFLHASSFQAHKKAHADIRDFFCQECDKAFRSISHLNRHIKTHNKQKNHICKICGAKFSERYNLTAHHTNIHLGISRKKRVVETALENLS